MNRSISLRTFWEGVTGKERTVTAIASKSMAHRLLIASALTSWQARQKGNETEDWVKRIALSTTSADIEATKKCLVSMETALFSGSDQETFLCGESGSTLRFLLPVVAALGISGAFLPQGRLSERPLSPLYEEMVAHGAMLSAQGAVPFFVAGPMAGGIYTIPGNISSQYITGLLFALPLLKEDSKIIITGKRESVDYIRMTLDVLSLAGISYIETEEGFDIPGGQVYSLSDHVRVEGDWSNAATWLTLGALCKDGITCENLLLTSSQGDKRVVDVLSDLGAKVVKDTEHNFVTVSCGENGLHGTVIDAGNIPDLIPVLSVAACFALGTTKVIHAERLKIKESDRLEAITKTLTALGGQVENTGDGLIIKGGRPLHSATVSSINDHRIVMMAAIASAIIADGDVKILQSEAINKSFPTFFEECKALGAQVEIIE